VCPLIWSFDLAVDLTVDLSVDLQVSADSSSGIERVVRIRHFKKFEEVGHEPQTIEWILR
jgi:hypothetical protein